MFWVRELKNGKPTGNSVGEPTYEDAVERVQRNSALNELAQWKDYGWDIKESKNDAHIQR